MTNKANRLEKLYIGINGGGTRTTLVAVDAHLNEVARIETGPSNHNNIGLERARETLQNALSELLDAADCTLADIGGLCAGLAGIDRPADWAIFLELFGALCPGVPITLENDGTIALVAGVGRRFGVIMISGTGSIAIAVDESGAAARAGGWGWQLDDGSGFAIGREVIRAVAAAHDGAQPPTALTGALLRRLAISDPTELITWVYAPGRNPNEIAGLASEAVRLAEQDMTATRIIVGAADALAHNAHTVIQRLNFGAATVPVILSGGLFDHSDLLRDRFIQTLGTLRPAVQPLRATRDAALGAAMLAIQKANSAATFGLGADVLPVHTRRGTEQRNRLTMTISQRPILDLLNSMNLEDARIAAIIAPNLPKIAALIGQIVPRYGRGGRILMVGAGTSGRLAVLDAVECRPTFGVTPDQVLGILAGGEAAMMGAVEGAEDSDEAGRSQLAALDVGALDTVIGVAASGSTPFVIGALSYAKERGALTASIANVVDAPISGLADFALVAPTGAEVITGSTRLRAGTAQKLILNMITTGTMVQAGRTFDNLMTDMAASNLKLNQRAIVIVAEATGLSLDEAADMLRQADGEIRTAVAAALRKVNPAEARLQLADVDGNLNRLVR